MNNAFFFVLFLLGGIFVLSGSAFANATLRYDYEPGTRISKLLQDFTNSKPNALEVAVADLNEDGIHEFIVRPADCSQKESCHYDILAEAQDHMIRLGAFEARSLQLGQTYTHGVRNILIFNQEHNDFAYDIYRWSALESKYEQQK